MSRYLDLVAGRQYQVDGRKRLWTLARVNADGSVLLTRAGAADLTLTPVQARRRVKVVGW